MAMAIVFVLYMALFLVTTFIEESARDCND